MYIPYIPYIPYSYVISIFFFFFGLLTSHVRPSIGYLSPICLEPIGFRKCVFETNVDYEIRLTRNGGDKSSIRFEERLDRVIIIIIIRNWLVTVG